MQAQTDAAAVPTGFVVIAQPLPPAVVPVEGLQHFASCTDVQLRRAHTPYSCRPGDFLRALNAWRSLEHLDLVRVIGVADSGRYPQPSRPEGPSVVVTPAPNMSAVGHHPPGRWHLIQLPDLKTLRIQDSPTRIRDFLTNMRVPTSTSVTIIVDCDAFPLSANQIFSAIPTDDGYVNVPALGRVTTASVEAAYGFFVKAQGPAGDGRFTLQTHHQQDPRTITARSELLNSALCSLPDLLKGENGLLHKHPLKNLVVVGETEHVSADTWHWLLHAYPSLRKLAVTETALGSATELFDALATMSVPSRVPCPLLQEVRIFDAVHSSTFSETVARCLAVRERENVKLDVLKLQLRSLDGGPAQKLRAIEQDYHDSLRYLVRAVEVCLSFVGIEEYAVCE